MAHEEVFEHQFEQAADRALSTGVRGAFVEGCTFGVASGLIYVAEALLFYVGTIFIARGTYTYLQMIEVLNLVVFTVTIGSQLMAFSRFPVSDFNQLLKLDRNTEEIQGILRPTLSSPITYPERADALVLKDANLANCRRRMCRHHWSFWGRQIDHRCAPSTPLLA